MTREDYIIPLAVSIAVNLVVWAVVIHLHLVDK